MARRRRFGLWISIPLACGLGSGPGLAIADDLPYRLISIEYDYDANGMVDAVSSYQYDAAGVPTGRTYTYIGDGVPDLFVTEDDEAATEDGLFSFDVDGLLTTSSLDRVNQSSTTESFDVVQTFTAGRLTRSDSSSNIEGAVSSSYSTFSYLGDDLDRVEERMSADDSLSFTQTFSYGADGLPDVVTLSSPAFPPFPGLDIVTSYSWRADGQADDVGSVWTMGAMVIAEGAGDYVYDAEGRRVAEVFSVTSGQGAFVAEFFGLDYRKTLHYDALGLLAMEEVDLGDDGTVEATRTATWEFGPCTPYFIWAPNGRPEFAQTADRPYVPGTGWQSARNCPEPAQSLGLLTGVGALAAVARRRSPGPRKGLRRPIGA